MYGHNAGKPVSSLSINIISDKTEAVCHTLHYHAHSAIVENRVGCVMGNIMYISK